MALQVVVVFLQTPTLTAAGQTRLFPRSNRGLLVSIALLAIGVVVAAVDLNAKGRKLNDATHDVEQLSIMADHHQATSPIAQHTQQPIAPGSIKVVTGLIQNQQLRRSQQRPDQRDPGELATAELIGRGTGTEGLQTRCIQCLAQALGEVPAIVDQFQVTEACIALGHTCKGSQGCGSCGDIGDGLPWLSRDGLGHIGNVGRFFQRAGGGQQHAGHQLGQDTFAPSIAPDDTGRRLINGQVHVGQQGFAIGELERQVLQGNKSGQPFDVSHQHLQKNVEQANKRARRLVADTFWKA